MCPPPVYAFASTFVTMLLGRAAGVGEQPKRAYRVGLIDMGRSTFLSGLAVRVPAQSVAGLMAKRPVAAVVSGM
jgi:hypothetical protein